MSVKNNVQGAELIVVMDELRLTTMTKHSILFVLLQRAAIRRTKSIFSWPRNHEYPSAFRNRNTESFRRSPRSITYHLLGLVDRPLPSFWNAIRTVPYNSL